MNQYMKKVLFSCVVGVFVVSFWCYIFFPWVVVPTKSSPDMLTLVNCGGPFINKIILRHYVNDIHISDYVLDLKIKPWFQKPQTYQLPQIKEGIIKVEVEFEDGMSGEKSSFIIDYEKVDDWNEKGLLIYTTEEYGTSYTINGSVYLDQYVYFISGENEICYFEKAGVSKWEIIKEAPRPKKFIRKERGYSPQYYGWKENQWTNLPVKTK